MQTTIGGSGYGEVYTNMTFSKCNNVPGGTYYITIPSGHFQTVDSINNPRTAFSICIYVNQTNAPVDLFDPWYDPDLPLSDNIDRINSTLDQAIKTATSTDVAIFYANYAHYQLDVIGRLSDDKIVDATTVMADTMDTIIKDFNDPEQDIEYSTALGYLSDEYVDTLSAAETPEQGQYVTAVYVSKQQELTQYAIMQAGERVKGVISSEEIDTMDDYYAAEDEIYSMLDIQALEDLIAYRNWATIMPQEEVVVYKLIYERLLNGSYAQFILVPFMFSIVAIILGTGLRSVSRGGRDD